MKSGTKPTALDIYALVFGLFLGLCILKFGDPVILDQKILPPVSLNEFWNDAWPTHWANWIFWPLVIIGVVVLASSARSRPAIGPATPQCRAIWLWILILPLIWLGWQMISATQTVDVNLTTTTLWQFCSCAACYFLGVFAFRSRRALYFLLPGILVAFGICLIRAVHQHVEFPQTQKFLLEGQRTGWTNVPPAMIEEMLRDQTLITTNGVNVINPAIAERFAKNRVMGTLVYPNALAGIILLLLPVCLVLIFDSSRKLRPLVRAPAIALAVGLSMVAFYWSGSKLGWLLAMFIGAVCLFRLGWPLKLKMLAIVTVAVLGLGVFAVRFHNYFTHGATSVTARFDYWRAAAETARAYPMFGTGPGTFQRPYARLKAPDAEMARLTHNDYLEQFSDSGVVGGLAYAFWIFEALVFVGARLWKSQDRMMFAVFLGLLGWFIQGLGEFGLYIPALAWIAFTLLGCAAGYANTGESDRHIPQNTPRQKPGGG